MPITVRDLMSSEPAVIRPGESIEAALTHLLDCEASELYVVDDCRRLMGVVPDFALLKARLIDNAACEAVERIMIAGLVTITPTTPALEVAPLFREGRCRQFPVVDEGVLVGQLARRDVLWMLRMAAGQTAEFHPNSPAEMACVIPAPRYLQSARALGSVAARNS